MDGRRNHENLFKPQTMKPFSSHNLSSNDLLDEKCNTNSILSCQHDAVSICSTYEYLQLLPLSIELNCSFSNFRNHLKTFCVSDPNHHPQVKKRSRAIALIAESTKASVQLFRLLDRGPIFESARSDCSTVHGWIFRWIF